MQVIGGVLTFIGHCMSGLTPGHWSVFVFVPGVAFAALAIVAGILLLRHDARGIPLSIAVQAAQAISIGAGWRYVALAGPRLTWIVASTGTSMELGAGGVFTAMPHSPDGTLAGVGLQLSGSFGSMVAPLASATWSFGINLIAIYWLVTLVRQR